jgi:hypothetical protein
MGVPETSELFGGRELEIAGQQITALVLDSNVVIFAGYFPDNTRDHEIRIENEIQLEINKLSSSLVVRYEPFHESGFLSENITELSKIVGLKVLHALPFSNGVLELMLEDDYKIRVMPLDKYEAWTYVFGKKLLSCPPGGFRS